MDSDGKTDEREAIRRDPVRLRLISANRHYAPHSCLAADVHIRGKVLWVVRRM